MEQRDLIEKNIKLKQGMEGEQTDLKENEYDVVTMDGNYIKSSFSCFYLTFS